MNIYQHKILILDFGSQFTQLIARRIRQLGIYCEIHPYTVSSEFIRQFAAQGIILSGGPNSVYNENIPLNEVFTLGLPILGICYGMQLMAQQLGGTVVANSAQREFGYAEINQLSGALLAGLSDSTDSEFLQVWMSHGDQVSQLPAGFSCSASNANCAIAAMHDTQRQFYGVQFHPEVTHTKQGLSLFERFVLNICHCTANWNMPDYISNTISNIRSQVGSDKVILGLSGGVDSTVAAVLIDQAIGKQLICIFVDTGLLRHNEAQYVMQTYAQHMGLNIIHINAQQEFYTKLTGVSDPELKRKIIGQLFVEIFQAESAKIDGVKWLAQGTIYPDVIESAGSSDTAQNIKSHHNVGGLPASLHLKLLEPLRDLFKDEVRKCGIDLGIPASMVNRHPFPGPGLAVRILGAVTPEFVSLLQQADRIFIEELRTSGYYDQVAQAFAVFLPIKSVGVMGDGRTYEYVISLRAVTTSDFMTASVADLPYSLITRTANRIINEVAGINRVVYDVSSKPPATIEWE